MGTPGRKAMLIFQINNRRSLFLWRLYFIQTLQLFDLNLEDALFIHYISDSVSLIFFVYLTTKLLQLVKVCLTHQDIARFLSM